MTIVISLVFTVSSCDLLSFLGNAVEAALYSVDGMVVDSRSTTASATGVSGVSVTLTAIAVNDEGTIPSYTGSTDSTGAFTISDMEPGTYSFVGDLDGWFIPPQTVTISGLAVDLDPIPAFQLDPNDAYGLSFILAWNDNVDDLDIHMNFPTAWSDGSMTTPYDNISGFNDEEIYWSNKTHSVDFGSEGLQEVAYQDRDDRDGFGPETVTLVRIPHNDTVSGESSFTSTDDTNGLYAAFGAAASAYTPFKWMGATVLFVNAYTSDTYISSGQGADSADAVVYAIQTLPKDEGNFDFGNISSYNATDMTSQLLGIYRMPDFTKIKSAQILRINMFRDADGYEWFQLVPDIRVIPEGPADNTDSNSATFLSVSGSSPYIVGVMGRPISQ